MTYQKSVFIGFEDLLSIQFECLHCHAKLTIPVVEAVTAGFYKCTVCEQEWFSRTETKRVEALKGLCKTLGEIKQFSENPNFHIALELAATGQPEG